jgi:signal transduction histidine kinase
LRVITNLIQNAFEAIPENRKGKITLELIEENGKALLKINDNGSGIPADVVEHIFSPYFTTKGSGTGLGLAMTKRIVEFWNGKIWFETSEEGTTFFIELPLA